MRGTVTGPGRSAVRAFPRCLESAVLPLLAFFFLLGGLCALASSGAVVQSAQQAFEVGLGGPPCRWRQMRGSPCGLCQNLGKAGWPDGSWGEWGGWRVPTESGVADRGSLGRAGWPDGSWGERGGWRVPTEGGWRVPAESRVADRGCPEPETWRSGLVLVALGPRALLSGEGEQTPLVEVTVVRVSVTCNHPQCWRG